jgi:hypothetical protein
LGELAPLFAIGLDSSSDNIRGEKILAERREHSFLYFAYPDGARVIAAA